MRSVIPHRERERDSTVYVCMYVCMYVYIYMYIWMYTYFSSYCYAATEYTDYHPYQDILYTVQYLYNDSKTN